ncbi:MAG: glycosyltransferase [Candidatus Eisenbacteria bacterium]
MLVVMLPAYNEVDAIAPLLTKIARTFEGIDGDSSVLLVDDGSTDGTIERAEETARSLGLLLIVAAHEANKGLGAALKTGFRRGSELVGRDGVLVGMDADNTHDPAVIPSMLEKLNEGYDVVIASRYAPGGEEVGLSLFRSILSRGASMTLRLFLPVEGARDYSCGFRAYRGTALARAFEAHGDSLITETGFVASAEVLLRLAYLPSRVAEVPLVLRYDLKGGASKMNITDTIKRYLRMITAGRKAIKNRGDATSH